ncbi:glycosyltransferase family 4 protein [Henriciella aquimarina]|uniref:glycosyltransferase family 4 protein n=1 Tax=Henriciella aquimarina TaxID=545261 RepID=UPI0009FCD5F9|nr:glycosyltransferase family 4 protein [Henriciella aquimarina]
MSAIEFPDLRGKTILQVIPELSAGGAERTTVEMAEAIREAGGWPLVASEGGRLVEELKTAGGLNVDMALSSKNPFRVRSNAGKLAKLIQAKSIDLIHARSRAPAWSAYWAAKKTGIPFVTTYHGAYSGVSGLKKVYNSIMARGDLVIANSEWTAAHVRSVHGIERERLITIPRGVDFEVFDPAVVSDERVRAVRESWEIGADEKRLVLLLPGRLTEWKGQKVAINALASLSGAERVKLLLVLAGDAQGRANYVAALEDRIVETGLGGSVRIVGHCEDMAAAYKAADIVLAPSTRPEAFGRVAAEASAMGKPVIVADHGGQKEIVIEGATGSRAEPGSAADLAASIRAILQLGPEGRAGMGEAGRQHVGERFSKRGLQAATLGVYKRLLETRDDR